MANENLQFLNKLCALFYVRASLHALNFILFLMFPLSCQSGLGANKGIIIKKIFESVGLINRKWTGKDKKLSAKSLRLKIIRLRQAPTAGNDSIFSYSLYLKKRLSLAKIILSQNPWETERPAMT